MNAKRLNLTWPCRMVIGAALLALMAPAPLNAAAGEECKSEGSVIVVGSGEATLTADRVLLRQSETNLETITEEHAIEVIIKDGKTTVRIDGEEVPPERIHEMRGGLVIMDEDGKEIETVRIGVAGDEDHQGLWQQYWIGGNEPNELRVEAAFEPKVMIGIHLDEPGAPLLRHLKLEPGTATLVRALHVGLPAEKAGLDEFDVIVKIDGQAPANPEALRAALAEKEPGDVIKFKIIHKGAPKLIKVTLDAYDAQAMAEAELIGEAPTVQAGPDMFFLGEDLAMPRWREFTGEAPKMRDFFIDEQNRLFEFRPRVRMEFKGEPDEADEPTGESDELDARLKRLDKRLAELDKMLSDLLKRAEKQSDK